MNNSDKTAFIINTLEKLFPEVPIPLHHNDEYTLLIAVLLSAQCTDERVNKITPLLFEKANNPLSMTKLTIQEIKNIINPCGLSNNKSKNIYNLSKILVEKYNEKVPNNFKELEQLPGVGHKTASVVMSQAFGIPAFPVDTHIHRLCKRWNISDGSNVKNTEDVCKKIFPKSKWNKLHLQIIFYGRKYSPARAWNIENDIITKTILEKYN